MTTKRYLREENKHLLIKQPIPNCVAPFKENLNYILMHTCIANNPPCLQNYLLPQAFQVIPCIWEKYISQITVSDVQDKGMWKEMVVPNFFNFIHQTDSNVPTVSHVGRPSPTKNLILNVARKDRFDHIITDNTENKRKNCKHCRSQTMIMCDKCNIPLLAKRFKYFDVCKG